MKGLIAFSAFTVVALLRVGMALPGPAEETLVLEAKINQSRMVSKSCDEEGDCSLSFEGTGSSNVMGNTKWTSSFTQHKYPSNPVCFEASGVMTFEGETGTITLSDTGYICPGSGPFEIPYVISSNWVITRGTGEFEGITGFGISEGMIKGSGLVVDYSGRVWF